MIALELAKENRERHMAKAKRRAAAIRSGIAGLSNEKSLLNEKRKEANTESKQTYLTEVYSRDLNRQDPFNFTNVENNIKIEPAKSDR